MTKFESLQSSAQWYVKFQVDNPDATKLRLNFEHHYIESLLRIIYKKLNEKCQRYCVIPIDNILFTQENVDEDIFIAYFVGAGDGFHRNFFTKNTRYPPKGWSTFKEDGLTILQSLKGDRAREAFTKTRQFEIHNPSTRDHFGLGLRDEPEEDSIPKLGSKEFTKATRQDLLIDFQEQMKSGVIQSVDEYIDLLEQKGYMRHAMTVTVDNNGFDKVVQRLQRLASKNPIFKCALQSLQQYVDQYQTTRSNWEIERAIKESGHQEFLDSFVKYILMKDDSKVNAVWLHGAANAGKTKFLKMLEEIFHVLPYTQTRSKFDLNYEQERYQPQMVTIDEGAFSTFFRKDCICSSKIFFEGEGYTHEAKHQHPVRRWVGVPIIVTSNDLPDVLTPKQKGQQGYNDYKAFETRIKYHMLEKEYPGKSKLPYNATDLAKYLQAQVIRYKEDHLTSSISSASDDQLSNLMSQLNQLSQKSSIKVQTNTEEVVDKLLINSQRRKVPPGPILGFKTNNVGNLGGKRKAKYDEKNNLKTKRVQINSKAQNLFDDVSTIPQKIVNNITYNNSQFQFSGYTSTPPKFPIAQLNEMTYNQLMKPNTPGEAVPKNNLEESGQNSEENMIQKQRNVKFERYKNRQNQK